MKHQQIWLIMRDVQKLLEHHRLDFKNLHNLSIRKMGILYLLFWVSVDKTQL